MTTLPNDSLPLYIDNSRSRVPGDRIPVNIANLASGLSDYSITDSKLAGNDASELALAFSLGNASISSPVIIDSIGNTLFVGSTGNSSILAVDITDPYNTSIIGVLTDALLLGIATLKTSGSILYAGTTNSRIVAVDVSDPSSMVILGNLNNASLGQIFNLDVSGTLLIAVRYNANTINSVDVSDPANMVILQTLSSASLATSYDIRISGDYAYIVTDSRKSIVSVSITDPSSMSVVDELIDPALGVTQGIAISGSVAFVSSVLGNQGLVAVDISDPSSMSILGGVSIINANRVVVSGEYAYVGTQNGFVYVVSLGVLSDMETVTSVQVSSRVFDILLSGNYLYVSSLGDNKIKSYFINGVNLKSLEAGNIATGRLDADEAIIAGNISARGSIGAQSINVAQAVAGAYTTQHTVTASVTADYEIDALQGGHFILTLNVNNPTITVANLRQGRTIKVWLVQGAGAPYTVTWSGIKWPSATPPVLSVGAGDRDLVEISCGIAGTYDGYVSGLDLS